MKIAAKTISLYTEYLVSLEQTDKEQLMGLLKSFQLIVLLLIL